MLMMDKNNAQIADLISEMALRQGPGPGSLLPGIGHTLVSRQYLMQRNANMQNTHNVLTWHSTGA